MPIFKLMFSPNEKCDKNGSQFIKKLIEFLTDPRWRGDPKTDISYETGGLMKYHLARSAGNFRKVARKRDFRSNKILKTISANKPLIFEPKSVFSPLIRVSPTERNRWSFIHPLIPCLVFIFGTPRHLGSAQNSTSFSMNSVSFLSHSSLRLNINLKIGVFYCHKSKTTQDI